jgi:uncharacterized protein YkwD
MPKQTKKIVVKKKKAVSVPLPKAPRVSVAKKPLRKKVTHHAKKLVVPNEHNGFRPRLVGRWGMLLLAVLVGAIYSGHAYLSSGRVLGSQAEITRTKLLDFTNDERGKNGASSLVLNDKLSEAAYRKAKDMFARQYWAHDAPDGTKPWKWLADVGYSYEVAGENLAKGFDNAGAIVRAWMESPTHKANLIKTEYTEVGFAAVDGVLNGKNTTIVVAMYGEPSLLMADVPNTGEMILGSTELSESFVDKLRRGFQSAAPSLVFILVLLGIAAAVSVLAHTYRKNLPTSLKRSWYKHHGLFKLAFVIILALGAILSYGGGMI